MIIESVVNLLVGLVKTLFGWISLPAFPSQLAVAITAVEDLVFQNLSMLGLFVRVSTLKIAIPIFVVIINFDRLYRLTMWVLRKLPIGID